MLAAPQQGAVSVDDRSICRNSMQPSRCLPRSLVHSSRVLGIGKGGVHTVSQEDTQTFKSIILSRCPEQLVDTQFERPEGVYYIF